MHNHLSAVIPPLLELCNAPPDGGDDRGEAALEALTRIIATVTEACLLPLFSTSLVAIGGRSFTVIGTLTLF